MPAGKKEYLPWSPMQSYLLPPSPNDWLPKDHAVYFMLDIVEELDLGAIERAIQGKDGRGQRPYHPAMMLVVLLNAYTRGVHSSRAIARACVEDVSFRILSGGACPHFTVINDFRRKHAASFDALFLQVLRLCQEAGMVKLGHVALDGTKVEAIASKSKAMSYDRMKKEEERLRAEIQAMLQRAEEVDAQEDALYGVGVDPDALPKELANRETRLERIRAAKRKLEEEAKQHRVTELREQVARKRESAEQQSDPRFARGLRTRAAKADAKAQALFPLDEDEPEPDATALPHNLAPCTTSGEPTPTAQRNFTDPESRIMQNGDGAFVQAYNCQAAVDEGHQVIVAVGVTNQAPDAANLAPMLERVIGNTGRAPDALTGDSGYWSPDGVAATSAHPTEILIATSRTKHGKAPPPTREGPPPPDLAPRDAMRWKLDTAEGRSVYRRRKSTVEPVFGQIKFARSFDRFSRRGLRAAESEWSFVATVHNLDKLRRYRARAAAT